MKKILVGRLSVCEWNFRGADELEICSKDSSAGKRSFNCIENGHLKEYSITSKE